MRFCGPTSRVVTLVFWGKGRRRTKESVDIEGRRKEERGRERDREEERR